jgi:hypothetical protein
MRFMTMAFGNFPKVFRTCYENLTPGGWLEMQDYYFKIQSIDDTLRGTALERWNDLILEAVHLSGRSGIASGNYKRQMEEVGFEDVVERKFALPGNSWPKGKDQKMLGLMQMANISDGLHGFSIHAMTKMGMAPEEINVLLDEVRSDLRNRQIHFYYIV